jgi:hypothetical protein
MIMTQPFSELNLMMLMPTSNPMEEAPSTAAPTSARDWLRLIRDERRKVREGMGTAEMMSATAPPRGEVLMIKQLVFFERYGKLFLADEPLIYNPEVYRTLLALPDLDAA